MSEFAGVTVQRVFFTEGVLSWGAFRAQLSDIDLGAVDLVHGEIGVGTNSVFHALAHLARSTTPIVVTLHDPPLFLFSPTLILYRYRTTGVANKALRKLVTDPLFNAVCLPRLASRFRNYMVLNRGAVEPLRRRFPGSNVRYAPLMASGHRPDRPSGSPGEVLFYGFMARDKGIELALEAVHALRREGIEVRLHVVGGCLDQAYERFLRDQTRRLSLEASVVWHGFVAENELDRVFDRCGMAVFPYREIRSLGGSAPVVRAMEHGLPVVLSDIRRFTAEYQAGIDALMFRAGDAGDLTEKMRRLAGDEGLRRMLARNSRRRIEEVHDARSVAGTFHEFYRDVLGTVAEGG
jgi:glycosyltransferase involved in cell wall biosynthesis